MTELDPDHQTEQSGPAGIGIRRGEIATAGSTYEGWIAEYDGTETVGISREDALKRLVVAVAQEGRL